MIDEIKGWLGNFFQAVSGSSQIQKPNLDAKQVASLNAAKKNPPLPKGAKLFKGKVSQEMVDWMIGIRDNSSNPMFTMATRVWDGKTLMTRIEWHTFQGKTGKKGIFRGMTLYEMSTPADEIAARWKES